MSMSYPYYPLEMILKYLFPEIVSQIILGGMAKKILSVCASRISI